MRAIVDLLSVGTSGWSYPSWRGGFYPDGAAPQELLALYAERLPSEELSSTGYRLPVRFVVESPCVGTSASASRRARSRSSPGSRGAPAYALRLRELVRGNER